VVREVLAISNNIIGNIIAKTIQSQQYRTSLQSNNMDQNLAILLLCPGLLSAAKSIWLAHQVSERNQYGPSYLTYLESASSTNQLASAAPDPDGILHDLIGLQPSRFGPQQY
jgi:hypothetical protein